MRASKEPMKMQEDNRENADSDDDLKSHYDFDYSKVKPNRFAARLKQQPPTSPTFAHSAQEGYTDGNHSSRQPARTRRR